MLACPKDELPSLLARGGAANYRRRQRTVLFIVAKRVLEQVKQLAEREGIGISILLEKGEDRTFEPYLQDDYAYVRSEGEVEESFNLLRILLTNLKPGDFVVYLPTSLQRDRSLLVGVTALESGEGRTE